MLLQFLTVKREHSWTPEPFALEAGGRGTHRCGNGARTDALLDAEVRRG
jgi:hypothetical protein